MFSPPSPIVLIVGKQVILGSHKRATAKIRAVEKYHTEANYFPVFIWSAVIIIYMLMYTAVTGSPFDWVELLPCLCLAPVAMLWLIRQRRKYALRVVIEIMTSYDESEIESALKVLRDNIKP